MLAQGKPLEGAHVRLYFRGRVDRNTGVIDWRFAGAGETGRDGIAHLPARPGTYLAAARSGTFAPAHLEFQRPAGEKTTKIALELRRGIALSGRTVQKGSAEPVPLALVTLTAGARRAESPAEEQARTTSDAQGRFRIDGLEPVQYVAKAQATGYAKATELIDASVARELTLELAAAAFIEGRVVTADGSGAGGAEVFATGGAEAVGATASDTGTFSLEVNPRTWMLGARRGDEAGRADSPVTVAAGATARGVTIKLGASSGIAGTVVTAVSQQPIAGARIAVSPHGSNGDSGRAVSDASGAFSVTGLPPGSYDVTATADGYTDATHRGVTVDQGQRFPLRIEMHQTGAVEGVVRDSSGHGIAFALVQGPLPGRWNAQQRQEARADESGAYRLGGLAPVHVVLSAMRDGSTFGATGATDVPEGGTAHLDFELKDEGVVTGHVRRQDGSLPPADTTVLIAPSGRGPRAAGWSNLAIDETGAYAASMAAGTYNVSVTGLRAGGSFRNAKFVTIEAGKTVTQDLVYVSAVEDAQGFSGTVLEPDGTPSPGATVVARRAFWLQTDESGRFHSDRPRADLPDTFDVTARNGGRTGTASVAPQQSDVTVGLQPAATLRGHLSSGPVDSFRVDVRDDQGPTPQSLEFTGDRFEMRDLPGLPVHVTVTTQDGRSAQRDLTMAPGSVQEIEIALQPLATVSGRAIDSATQQPIAGVSFSIDDRPEFGDLVSGGDGRFQLRAASGDHTLHGFASAYNRFSRTFTVAAGQPLDLGDLAFDREKAQPGTIGISLRGDSETPPTVSYLIAGGPADRAGVHLGDQIAAVDGAAVTGVPDATSRIKGAPATPVQLTLQRSGQQSSVTIQRAP